MKRNKNRKKVLGIQGLGDRRRKKSNIKLREEQYNNGLATYVINTMREGWFRI